MEYQLTIVEEKDRLGIIALNRPKVRNALNSQMMDEMICALSQFDSNPDIGAVILKGSGPAFCAGHDFSELSNKPLGDIRQTFGKSIRVLQTMSSIGKPVIAAVHGIATAMGCALAAGCDLVIASEDARFQTPGVNLGFACISPMAALFRSIGRKKCLEMILTGESIDAHEAERIGLVNKVVPTERLEDMALEFAKNIARKAPLAVQLGKQAFYTMADMEHNQAYKYAAEMISINADTEDGQEGIAAFVGKRPPQPWRGR
ncbi:MAG: enoyl-CoA hydratase/isomerase family protein [Dehalococcoidia bacterium]|nr:enoyl-CoA hydratase/isomerase family protein [Dehalococcoidia bacterium]